jgi:hypothetical protein
LNDASVFEGDSIRTAAASAGVLRVGQGRIEVGESSQIEIVRRSPLRIIVNSGSVAMSFPSGTPLEIVTPQLEVRPGDTDQNLSAVVTVTPNTEDRVQSRAGIFTIVERQKNGQVKHIVAGEVLLASLLPALSVSAGTPEPIPSPQGPLGSGRIAVLSKADGDVRVARAATPNNFARVGANLQLAGNDFVRTLNGRAEVLFDDQSVLTLQEGTTIQIQQQARGNTTTRRIMQYIGNLWFRIQRVTGTETTLETPTAVAAIRGTEGTQEVPNDNQSTHSLNEGVEDITEVVSQQSITIRSGQRVTAIRGIGFSPVVALIAAITQPIVGPGGGGAGAGGAGGVVGGAAVGVATVSTATTVTAVTAGAVAATTGTVAALVPNVARQTPAASQSIPLNPPGGA